MKTSIRAALIALALFCCIQAFAWTPRIALASLSFQAPNAAYGLCFTDIGGSGCTIGLECRDTYGVLIPFYDTAGNAYSTVTLTLGASASLGMAYGVLNSKPDGSHYIARVPTFASVYVRCVTGTLNVPTLAINTGGLATGAAGTSGNGYNTGWNPNSSSGVLFYVTDAKPFGQGAQQ